MFESIFQMEELPDDKAFPVGAEHRQRETPASDSWGQARGGRLDLGDRPQGQVPYHRRRETQARADKSLSDKLVWRLKVHWTY